MFKITKIISTNLIPRQNMMTMHVRSMAAIIFLILISGCAPYPYGYGHNSMSMGNGYGYGYGARPVPYGNYGNRSYQQYQPYREHNEYREREHENGGRGYGEYRRHDND